jgi:hypothetical protein
LKKIPLIIPPKGSKKRVAIVKYAQSILLPFTRPSLKRKNVIRAQPLGVSSEPN